MNILKPSRLYFSMLMVLAMLLPGIARADDAQIAQARQFTQLLVGEVVAVLAQSLATSEREDAFRRILNERFEIRRTARFVLGTYARRVSKQDFNAYVALANDFIIKIYAQRLGNFSNEKVEITRIRQNRNNFIVDAQLIFANERPPLALAFWVVRSKRGKYSLFDIQVANIWMAQEQRSTFVTILNNNNGDINALIEHIRAKISA